MKERIEKRIEELKQVAEQAKENFFKCQGAIGELNALLTEEPNVSNDPQKNSE